jgi:DNA-binding CsgD family transcriptional regulator
MSQLGMLHIAMADLRLWQGRPADAHTWALGALHRLAGSDRGLLMASLLAVAARAEADMSGDRADELVTTLAAELPQTVMLTTLAEAHLAVAQAELSRAAGPDPQMWATAAQRWADLRCPYPMAYAQWRQAEALLNTRRRRASAAQLLRRAHHVATRLDARPMREELERSAQRARLTLTAATTDPTDADSSAAEHAPFSLTRRELEVLGRLATGCTNRQIAKALYISEKTVSIHVSRVLTKLGVPNRAAAAALAHRDGLVSRSA